MNKTIPLRVLDYYLRVGESKCGSVGREGIGAESFGEERQARFDAPSQCHFPSKP
jgi:hypothetical protein